MGFLYVPLLNNAPDECFTVLPSALKTNRHMDITTPKVTADKLETSVAVAPALKQEMVAKLYPHRGHRVFKLDRSNGEISEETPVSTAVLALDAADDRVEKKVQVKPGFLYITALNKKNATKKFVTMMRSRMMQSTGTPRVAIECKHQYQRYGQGTERTCVLCGEEKNLATDLENAFISTNKVADGLSDLNKPDFPTT